MSGGARREGKGRGREREKGRGRVESGEQRKGYISGRWFGMKEAQLLREVYPVYPLYCLYYILLIFLFCCISSFNKIK